MDEYISREALIDLTRKFLAVIDQIKIAPAADVAEVKHGWWLQNGMCSECLVIPKTSHKSYCPNCGTKMDGKRKDGVDNE